MDASMKMTTWLRMHSLADRYAAIYLVATVTHSISACGRWQVSHVPPLPFQAISSIPNSKPMDEQSASSTS